MTVGSLALIGFPGLSGFFSKDIIIEALHHSRTEGAGYAYWCALAGVFVTALYSFRLVFMTFHGKERMDEHTREHLHESPWVVTLPLIALAIPAIAIGWLTVGPVVFGDDGDRVDCAKLGKGGYSVPSIVEPEYLEIRRCTADFLLLVEKGTQWNRLSEDKFWRRYNCVLLTGNGQPPRGVRRLARRLHEEHKLPVYVLVDNDPWGYYIYSVIKQGSINLAFESQRMAIPKAKFIGLSSADPERYELPRNVGIKLNEKDIARAKELMNYQWFQKPAWQAEIKRMLTSGLKYELDSLANKDFQYLTKKYLPRKLKEKDWID